MTTSLDFQIVNALQINPRIGWSQLGSILRADPTTLSRRWGRLTERGTAWSSCFYMAGRHSSARPVSALVEVRCAPGRREEVMAQLSLQPLIFSVHCTSGARDLYLTVSAPTVASLDRYVDDRIVTTPGVTGTRTHYVRTMFLEGSSWSVDALQPAQAAAVEATLPARTETVPPSQQHLRLIDAIGSDVRRPVSELQERLGRSHGTVARAIDLLLTAEWARWRIDFAHTELGWATSAMLWMRVPQRELETVAAAMRLLPQVRLCASVTGASNLVASLWLRDLGELDEVEGKLGVAFPSLEVTDRWLVPRAGKRSGHVLGPDGRHERHVPFPGPLGPED